MPADPRFNGSRLIKRIQAGDTVIDQGDSITMTWNYRVVHRKTIYTSGQENLEEHLYQIHEAYYEEDKEKPRRITVNPVTPCGETLEELRAAIAMYITALDKPVIDWEEFRGATPETHSDNG